MEVITFGPNMDLSSKKTGDVFRLKLYGIEYDVKVVGDVGQKYCNKEQKTICLCNVSFFIFIEKSAGL